MKSNKKYTTIKIKSDDHRKLKVKAAERGMSMVDLFSSFIDKIDLLYKKSSTDRSNEK
jgi:hypothetical protein